MSLKAKIEAVIYAAEEPVTLAQLVGLLGQEAQAELDRLRELQGRLALERATEAEGTSRPSEPDLPQSPQGEGPATDAALESGAMQGTAAALGEPLSREGQEERGRLEEPDGSAEGAMGAGEATAQTDEPTADGETALEERRAARVTRERDRAVREHFGRLLTELVREYAEGDRGLEIREVAGGYRFSTKPEYHDAVRGFVKALKPPLRLTLQALETLAVVAYKQPVTGPEISEIRGVDSGGVLGSLMARKLITTAGRKQVIGRPILYRTTRDFLLRFGLKDTSELPSIEEFEKMAGELAEQEEMTMTPEEDAAPGPTGAESPHTDPELARGGTASPGSGVPGGDVVGGGDGGGSIEEVPAREPVPSQADVTEPQSDGDSSPVNEASVEGRPPAAAMDLEEMAANSSAGETATQGDERR